MERFKALQFTTHPCGNGERAVMEFPNGYSASVVRGTFSYGGPELFELAVIEPGGNLASTKQLTDSGDGTVVGWCKPEKIDQLLGEIYNLLENTEEGLDHGD